MQQQSLRDLTYYRADLAQIAPLSREEEVGLVGNLRLARTGALPVSQGTQARHRLVEGNQYLVVFLALRVHRHFRRQGLEDLIQEANLSLLEATEQCPYRTETFSGYASLAIRRGFARACCHDLPVYVSLDILHRLYKRKELRELALFHAASLDQPVEAQGETPLAETLAAPPLTLSNRADDSEKTALVQQLLAGLTEQQRQVVCLRFGLDPEDGREWSLAEIAGRLNLPESNVTQTLKRALVACRRLYEQQVPQQEYGSTLHTPYRYQEPRNERMAHKRLEQFQKLEEAALALRAQGKPIGAKRLAALAHVDDRVAAEYVRMHQDEAYEHVQQRAEQERLEEASALLQTQGRPVTLNRLCQLTGVGIKSASTFLHAKAGNAQERLATAYAQLQAGGVKTIGRKRLAQAAQVSQNRAGRFLRKRQVTATVLG